MTPYELGILSAQQNNVPGHLKQAYARGFAGALEKRAWNPLRGAQDWTQRNVMQPITDRMYGVPKDHTQTSPRLYQGDTASRTFYADVNSRNPDRRVVVTPRQVLSDSYRDPYRLGEFSPSIFSDVLTAARQYRAANPDRTWLQRLDDAALDKPVRVIRATRGNTREGFAAQFNRFPRRQAAIPVVGNLAWLNSVLQHEVAGHGLQRIAPLGRDLYIKGLKPTIRERISFSGNPRAYHLQEQEIEARLRQLQQDARLERAAALNQGLPFEDVEDPANARRRLQSAMEAGDHATPGLDTLPGVFKTLTPEQQKYFLDYWSKQMPGLVRSRQRPAERMKIAQQKNAGYCR